jgi:hypothetical protein
MSVKSTVIRAPFEQRESQLFYRAVLERLTNSGIPFLVGGSFALAHYMHLDRQAKDLDLFVARDNVQAVLDKLAESGYRAELTFPHWLAKVFDGADFIDIVFNSGNGICVVDDSWFDQAVAGEVFDVPVRICAPEETIWSKAFIMERERYDGADIMHLVRAYHERIDWPHLLARFGHHWRVLLSHLVLFAFIYPSERDAIPGWVMRELLARMARESPSATSARICNGSLLSRSQYRVDIEKWGYRDARLKPLGNMTEDEAASWTSAADSDE